MEIMRIKLKWILFRIFGFYAVNKSCYTGLMLNFACEYNQMIHMKGKTGRILTGILFGLILVVTLGLYGWSASIYANTLMPVWIPVGVALAVAGITAPFYALSWRRIVPWDSKVLNVLWHCLVACSVGAFIVMGGNCYGARADSEYTETVIVVGRSQEKHDTYRRVGRNRHVKSGTRTDYKVSVMYPDSLVKKWPVSLNKYNRIRKGATYSVVMRTGMFGYPVVVRRPF